MKEKTILLVEDNNDSRVIYATCLESSGYRVLEARRGEAGVELARDRLPDLILMDLHLPGLSGLDAARMLKADPSTAHIPIVAVTAGASELNEELRAAGCEALLAKPVDPLAVRDAVRDRLGPAVQQP
jgi:two-component system, cell cycle response regulator DivK